jgi:hypothetical protein
MVSNLIIKANELGFDVTLGDAYRDPRWAGDMGEKGIYGRKDSCHKLRLAIDINLFKGGQYLSDTESHRELGEWWESVGGSWGGRFNDGNHYSLEHQGVR